MPRTFSGIHDWFGVEDYGAWWMDDSTWLGRLGVVDKLSEQHPFHQGMRS